ncbi:hypothetical protein HY491_04605 [Candidatus Woesearchaeota archaeon]|nr:hypothetical protein [Candidatus Woesearchaeota archaeon]
MAHVTLTKDQSLGRFFADIGMAGEFIVGSANDWVGPSEQIDRGILSLRQGMYELRMVDEGETFIVIHRSFRNGNSYYLDSVMARLGSIEVAVTITNTQGRVLGKHNWSVAELRRELGLLTTLERLHSWLATVFAHRGAAR